MQKLIIALFAVVLFVPPAAHAQAWPAKPIRFVLPFGPGSATDALARIAGEDLSRSLGQPVVVAHRAGADGALSAMEVKRSPADGYTFLFGTNSPLAVVPNIRKEPPYDVIADFTPISYIGDNTFFIVVHPSLPVKTVTQLVTLAKANPKVLNYPVGNTYALVATAIFAQNNGIQMHAVPYKGEPDAMADLLSGRVHLMFGTSTNTLAHVNSGKLRALVTTLQERSPLLPDVPSFPESGQTKLPIGPWFAMVAPAGLPREIVARMNREMVATLGKASVKEAMLKHGFMTKSSTPEALATYLKEQLGIWKTALKSAGVEPQ